MFFSSKPKPQKKQKLEPRLHEKGGEEGSLRLTEEERRIHGRARRAAPSASPAPMSQASTKGRSLRRKRGVFSALFYWSMVLGIWGLVALGGIIAYFAMKLPPIDQLSVPKRPPNIAIIGADGGLIANRGETGGSNVAFKDLPPYVPRAFVAIEDHRFYQHFGIDLLGLGRAVLKNITSRRLEQGGSTLTQQLAKNIFLTQERTLSRKVQEALLSLWLEKKYTKDQILELYMNRVYFGSGAYGIEAAAQKYFGKSAKNLTIGEAGVLGGLVQSPSRLAPNRNPEGAAARAKIVVKKMAEQGFISQEAAETAKFNTEDAKKRARPNSGNYVADWVIDILDDYVGAIEGDIIVKTTIEPRIQALAEKTLINVFEPKRQKLDVEQVAIVALSPDGAVRAMIGGRDYAESQFNRAVAAKRQPGSSFKPLVYLAALERGLTPDTIREDGPISVRGWKPENYTHEYFGDVTLKQALAMSLNTVVVRLILEVGPKNVVKLAQRLGIHSQLKPNESLALGTSEVSPIEMVSVYCAFANGGIGVIPHVILEVVGADKKVYFKRQPQNLGQVIAPATLAELNSMMRETLVNGTGKRADLPGYIAAGKTGTTQDYRDAWFVGYTGSLVAAVWLGNDDNTPMKKVTGSGLPTEIWADFMKAAHKGLAPQPLLGASDPLYDALFTQEGGAMKASSPPPSAQNLAAPQNIERRNDENRPDAWQIEPSQPSRPTENGLLQRLFGR